MATIKRRKRKASPLRSMKLGQAKWLKEYEYGVSHVSESTGREFIQRTHGKRVLCVRVQ